MYQYKKHSALVVGFIAIALQMASAQKKNVVKPVYPVDVDAKGKLVYVPDSLGNRVPDFSYCGYMASGKEIPVIGVKVVVPVKTGDATVRIQAALDYVASLPVDNNGFRGAVLLEKGTYEVLGGLQIKASGVVLRGSGMGEDGTMLLGAGDDRQTLIRIVGKNDKKENNKIAVTDNYVPVNATTLTLASVTNLKVGDDIFIQRPSTKEWIETLGTAHFGGGITALGWKPGERDIFFDRKITAIKGNTITIDAPLTTALDKQYGGGTVNMYQWNGRINNAGVENLRCVSTFDKNNLKDESHRWMAITIENAQDAWVRQVTFEHFAGSAVSVLETSKRVTVEDCKSLAPVSEIGGQRRYTFLITGQQALVQRCYAEFGYHDFAVGYCAPGPNAFVQCENHLPYNFSGGIDSWASGILFDVVSSDGNALRFGNRGQDGQGAGWSAANSVFWNCSAARIDCYQPPTAQNWSFGSWAQFSGDGYWGNSNNTIGPRSFFYAQLAERLSKNVEAQAQIIKAETEASSSPSVKVAAELTAQSVNPRLQLTEWIDMSAKRNPISTEVGTAKTIDAIGYKTPVTPALAPAMKIVNGKIVRGNELLVGRRISVPWWSGGVHAADLQTAKSKPAITRYVPGREGEGLTDDLNELTDKLKQAGAIGMEQNYALWYERRRDDHERIRRMDGEVWPPFYELPFARTGQDFAWDGLSKYDLTKYNKWYWRRLKQYADLADQKGLLLVHQDYFQHNIIEAGAHYADFPWRPVNNINNTGFPEPVPFAGDKRVFMAEQFYDTTHPVRAPLHRAYIRQCLDNFADNNGVIQTIGEEFTGPLHFVQFWVNTIAAWEKEKNKKEIISLSVTKDVQDAILADNKYAATIDVIDIRYWHYRSDSSAYAPLGGQNLAPRQHARLVKPGKTSFDQVYRAVSEYKTKYPEKAVMYSGDSFDSYGWAVFMAGGSLPVIPAIADKNFLSDAATMDIVPLSSGVKDQWMLSNKEKEYVVYNASSTSSLIDLTNVKGQYKVQWINPSNGSLIKEENVKTGKVVELKKPQGANGAIVAWIHK
ncbi:DUF6298 domain-containing protein [Pinibacter soli]|uniref:DUF6298 domain-containing protein n=1 Tax=Pinibacter soli TaxID=3044211 RepID=A0ABT6RF45_9BACT|nr:DUF6298 domain-containing protein [Pinibacter soli]MDI3321148.1 DUF6298 domain-containing protein [Pinibacter soli]